MTRKRLVPVWTKKLSVPEKSSWALSEDGMVNSIWSYLLWNIEGRYIKNLLSQQKIPKSCIFKGWYLANGKSEPKKS